MKCFYHRDTDSVGLCRNCCRALCADCLVDLDEALACRGRCEQQVQAGIELSRRSAVAYDKIAAHTKRSSLVNRGFGILSMLGGVGLSAAMSAWVGAPFIVLGAFLLACGWLSRSYGRSLAAR